MTGALAAGALERLLEHAELAPAPDERGLGTLGASRASDIEQEERSTGRTSDVRLGRLGPDRVADEPVGGLADHDLSGPGGLREPGGPSERLPAHEPLGRPRVALEDLAGVDPDANVDRDCSLLLELLVQTGHCLPQLERRTHGTKGIVLVQSRDAEDRGEVVAERSFQACAVEREHLRGSLEIARDDPPANLGVEDLVRRAPQARLGENERDRLAGQAATRCCAGRLLGLRRDATTRLGMLLVGLLRSGGGFG